jgi:hypothetical protein
MQPPIPAACWEQQAALCCCCSWMLQGEPADCIQHWAAAVELSCQEKNHAPA